ncbi:hypothetical protein DL771_000354 [Monosporascus sp. 5C6A]|nr:hypothetical protein DL771_000354 [Monosporascus sp. 5C6A]
MGWCPYLTSRIHTSVGNRRYSHRPGTPRSFKCKPPPFESWLIADDHRRIPAYRLDSFCPETPNKSLWVSGAGIMPSSSSSRDQTTSKEEALAANAIPEASNPTQRPAKRSRTSPEGEPDDRSDQKRRRRAFSCISCRLIDEDVAKDLVELVEALSRSGGQREASAFLHSVCCLHGIVYRKDLCGTPLHRQIYDQVRLTLGQALLSSPLTLDEINAVFLMSNNPNTPSNQGSEYIDSWLLTGYCAKQSMLSISFSRIATMQDAVLVAEVVLYSNLHQRLSSHSYLGDGGNCDDFMSWRQEWNHLWALPTSSMLKVGYYAACLILSLRCLEENGGALQPKMFLSDGEPDTSSEDAQACAGTRHDRCAKDNVMRAHAFPTCLCLCIGYCALVLAHYDESQSKIPDPVSLNLTTRIDDWVRNAPGKAWSFKYGELARRNVEARIRKTRRAGDSDGERSAQGAPPAGDRTIPQGDPSVSDSPISDDESPSPSGVADAGLYNPDEWISPGHPLHSATVAPSYEQALFPSLECYFGGGIYDFTG